MAISYCTLQQASYAAEIGNTDGKFENFYTAMYDQITRRIDHITQNNTFAPRIETRYFDGVSPSLRNGVLFTNYPLLSLTAVTLNGTAATLSDFELLAYNGLPATQIYSSTGWTFTSTRRHAIGITGIWGYRTYYSQDGWLDITTLNGAIGTTTATTVTLTSAANVEAGDMLQVDSEWLSVTSKDGNNVTVKRGIRGSTAATHLTAATVSKWLAEPDIASAAAKMVGYAYTSAGKYEQVQFDVAGGGVAVQLPADLPNSVTNVLAQYRLGYSELV